MTRRRALARAALSAWIGAASGATVFLLLFAWARLSDARRRGES